MQAINTAYRMHVLRAGRNFDACAERLPFEAAIYFMRWPLLQPQCQRQAASISAPQYGVWRGFTPRKKHTMMRFAITFK